MDLTAIAEPALAFDSAETLSRVVSGMLRERKYEVLVFDGKKMSGVATAWDIAKGGAINPDSTKIRKFVKRINPVPPETPLRDAIKLILIDDYKSVPVDAGGKYLMLTKLGILKSLRNSPEIKGRTASDIMRFPFCVSSGDSIATAVSVLRESGVSRIPIINSRSMIEGLVDTIDLLKADFGRQRASVGERSGESLAPREDVLITSLMRKDVPVAPPGTPLDKLIDMMAGKGTQTVLVEENGKLAGIVTPKRILKLIGWEVGGVHVTISGIKDEDAFIKSVIDEEVRNEMSKLCRFLPIDYMVLHVDHYHTSGRREKYSVKGRLITEDGMFFADDHDWDITKAVRGVLQKMEKEVIRRKEKREVYRRGP